MVSALLPHMRVPVVAALTGLGVIDSQGGFALLGTVSKAMIAATVWVVGSGGGVFGFLHSDPLAITVEIHSDATDIHIRSIQAHDLDVSVIARVGGMAEIEGCARIEGPTLKQISMFGMLEHSAAAGSIFGPKAGFETEINLTVTPTTLDFYAAGDMILYPASSLHRVTPVARGVRLASIFWVQSMVRDDGERALLFDLDMAISQVSEHAPDNPGIVPLTSCYHNLLRRWSGT